MTEHDRDQGSFEPDLRAADDLAAAAIHDDVTSAPAPATSPPITRGYAAHIVTAVCLVVVVTQIPALRASFKSVPSIRVGATDVDDDTDACIDTLWKVSHLLQYGSFQGGEWVEPLTRRPYIVRQHEGHTVVECPNPGEHQLRSLQVSSAHRAPEAVK